MSLGGRFTKEADALEMVDAFIAQPWSAEERHQRRIDILEKYEETGFNEGAPEPREV